MPPWRSGACASHPYHNEGLVCDRFCEDYIEDTNYTHRAPSLEDAVNEVHEGTFFITHTKVRAQVDLN